MGMNVSSERILNEVTTTGSSESKFVTRREVNKTFQATGQTTAGAGAATIIIEASNETTPTNFVTLATISLTLSTATTADGPAVSAAWRWMRARVSAISGTGAAVSVWMGG